MSGTTEAFAQVKIDALLRDAGWDLTDGASVLFEHALADGTQADYVLCDRQGGPSESAEVCKGYRQAILNVAPVGKSDCRAPKPLALLHGQMAERRCMIEIGYNRRRGGPGLRFVAVADATRSSAAVTWFPISINGTLRSTRGRVIQHPVNADYIRSREDHR